MKFSAKWSKPLAFKKGDINSIFSLDTSKIPKKPGCYVIYNMHGDHVTVLYIGKATGLRGRINGQLNNLRLMLGVKNSLAGKKYLIWCTLTKGSGRVLVFERSLIRHAMSEGHQLLNIQGTRRAYTHEINMKGNRTSERIFGRTILVGKN